MSFLGHKPRRSSLAGDTVLALLCLLGAAAFLYPFFLSSPAPPMRR
jgi:hypothetical protein